MLRHPSRFAATVQAMAVVFVWATSWVLVKGKLHDIPPLSFAGLRYALAVVCLLALLLGRPAMRSSVAALSRRDWLRLGALGLLLYGLTQAAVFLGLTRLPAVTVSLLLGLTPALVTVLAVPLLKEVPRPPQAGGVLVSVAGTLVYFGPVAPPAGQLEAVAVVAVGVVAFAAATLLGRSVNRDDRLPALTVTVASMGIGSGLLLIVAVAHEGVPRLTPSSWLVVLWLAVVNTAVAFTVWNHTMRRLSATESSLINNTMLVHVAVLAWVFLGERPGLRGLLGLALVAGGVVLVSLDIPSVRVASGGGRAATWGNRAGGRLGVREMFKHEDFRFGFEIALGGAYRGYSDVGEVLATAERVEDGDGDSWVREWGAIAERLEGDARAAEAAGQRVSARGLYLRAANYFATGLYLITRSSAPERQLDIWRRHRACWDKVVDLSAPPGERLQIGYEGTTLPGYFFRAPDAEPGERRPLVVLNNGSDGATSHMGLFGGLAANERGYHAMTFDGPGQQAALFLQGIPFRHDWEAVLTPVVDAMVARPDVDPDRIAVIGVSQAGYWVPRALAFEHRFAAAVADPGVVDVSTSWTGRLPGFMRAQLQDPSKKASFDKEMGWTERLSKSTRATLHFRGEPYGVAGDSRFDLYREVLRYRLGDEVADITTPLLITEPEDEQFWPGQSQELYDLLPGPKELVRFTAAEGANRHCEPMGLGIRDARVFGWLARHLDT